ncbi:MAG: YceH family protein [Aliivibrio sp.]|uniref:YceH family protein n=1 Tax=Aliivibrio sp. TaxID=1872443 RepID=UPI001A549F49|nr:YceH family protein [Aliivibrio sp.]
MTIQLSFIESRIIGCLLEKEITTPDQYPLTLNALTSACNQKSNREPVVQLSESDVQDGMQQLMSRHLVSELFLGSSRVAKYQHRFCNTEFGNLKFTQQEFAIICVLLLRGDQTPGELRTRTNRLCTFSNVTETEQVIAELEARDLLVKLPREPGKRESRYAQLFTERELQSYEQQCQPQESVNDDSRMLALEQEVVALRTELELLKEKLAKCCEDER